MTRRRALGVTVEVSFPILLLVVWALVTERAHSFYFPRLTLILKTFRDDWLFSRVASDVVPSLIRLGIGYVVCVLLGVTAGIVIGRWRLAAEAASPIVEFLRALPPPALIPFGILVLGVGDTMKIFIIVLGSIWPILLGTIDGVRGIDPVLLDTARSYRLSKRYLFRNVILPAAAPQILAGMRTALSVGLILMVVSELVASTNGIGYFVLESERTYAIPDMWSGIILLGVLGYLFNMIFTLVERRLLRWHRGAHRASEDAI